MSDFFALQSSAVFSACGLYRHRLGAQMSADLIQKRNTHLLDWLSDGWTHCQHGTKEWCEAYLHNARDVIKAQDDTLTANVAELAEMAAENERLRKALIIAERERDFL